MSVIDKLASSLGRNDELPNQELAAELCRNQNMDSIRVLIDSLFNARNAIKNDSIKVLYEIGETEPKLISPYVREFLKLLGSKNNRLVWGGMTALSTIAKLNPEPIFTNIDSIFETIRKGSVITVDQGISVLAKVGSMKPEYEKMIFPFLLEHLTSCRPRELPQHAERCTVIINSGNKNDFVSVLEKRWNYLTPSQQLRIKRVIKKVSGLY